MQELPGLHPAELRRVRLGDAGHNHLAPLIGRQLLGAFGAHRAHHAHGLVDGCLLRAAHPLALVADVKAAHPARVLSGHARGARVGVAPLRLDAPGSPHHRSRRIGVVRAPDDPRDDVAARRDLAARTRTDTVTHARAHEGVVYQHQPVRERHAHVVLELDGGGVGAPFRAVHDDEVRRGADFLKRLDHGCCLNT